MTCGKRESHAGGVWHAPKRDLISGLQAAMLEKREIEIPANYGPAFLLGKELVMSGLPTILELSDFVLHCSDYRDLSKSQCRRRIDPRCPTRRDIACSERYEN